MIRLRDVSYEYPEGTAPALRHVDLDVAAGEICAVLGASGAGKSTLARVVAGFCPHYEGGDLSGTVHAADLDVSSAALESVVTQVGLLQENPFDQISGARFTVREEVAFGLENLGVPAPEMATRVDQMLDEMNIAHLSARSPYALSGGQQQLVALASILVMRPQVVVLDEPTAQLDPAGTDMVFAALDRLRDFKVTTLVIEHKVEPIAHYADQVVVLVDGEVEASGRPSEVLGREELGEWGVEPTRFSQFAREMQARGRWPADTPVPVSLTTTVEVLGASLAQHHSGGTARDGDLIGGRIERKARPTGGKSQERLAAGIEANELVVEDLDFRFPDGVIALDGVSLRITQGERVAIIGENGAGKTTLVKHLIGIHRPDRGRVCVGEWDTREHTVAALARKVGYLFQNPAEQLFARTVRREVEFGPVNLGFAPHDVVELVDRALATLSLRRVEELHPYQLTTAERKRVALASVLAMDTPVVVLDEPTTGQDQPTIEALKTVVRMLTDEGKTVVAVTHDMDFAVENFDRVVIMARGHIIGDYSMSDAFHDPDVLRQAAVHPPQIIRLATALGLDSTALTVAQLADHIDANMSGHAVHRLGNPGAGEVAESGE